MIDRVKLALGITITLFGFIFSCSLGIRSFAGDEFIRVDEILGTANRDIATVKKDLGLTRFTDHMLISTSPLKALSQARMFIKPKQSFQLVLGHFSTKNNNNELVLACQIYDKVSVTYEAFDDVSSKSDKVPQSMVLETDCKIAENDILHLSPINLWPEKVLSETPADGIYEFTDQGSLTIKFENVEDHWAKQWRLKSVKFSSHQQEFPSKEISALDLPVRSTESLNMDWSNFHK